MKTIVHAIDEMKMGGAQTHLLTILNELRRQNPADKQVLVVLFDDLEFTEELRALNLEPTLLNLRPFFEKKQFYKAYTIILKLLKKIKPDVVETHLTWSRLLVNTAAYQLKIPKRIGFEHGDIYMNSFKMRLANFTSQFLFNKIIVCSEALKKWVKETHYIQSKKIKVLYNCVDLKKFKPVGTKNLKEYLGFEQDIPSYTFVTVGTMGKGVNKRMDISIKAIAEMRSQQIDAGLVICGDGEQRTDLEQLAAELGIAEQVYFLGNRRDVHKILPHCFAYVHSAAYEPFGIVCIEAMSSGLPVILPDSGGIQYIINDKIEGRIYKSLNFQDLAEKMAFLTKNSTRYANYSQEAQIGVKKYGVTAYVNTLYQMYAE